MVNRLSIERRSQIIGALVEGNSIRSVERMTNTHRDTITRLGFEVGTFPLMCAGLIPISFTSPQLQQDVRGPATPGRNARLSAAF